MTVERQQDDDDGQKDKFNSDELTDYNAELVDKNILLLIMIVERDQKDSQEAEQDLPDC